MPPMLPPQSAQHPAARRKIRSGGGGGGGVCVVAVGVAVVWLSTTVVGFPALPSPSRTNAVVVPPSVVRWLARRQYPHYSGTPNYLGIS